MRYNSLTQGVDGVRLSINILKRIYTPEIKGLLDTLVNFKNFNDEDKRLLQRELNYLVRKSYGKSNTVSAN